MFEQRIVNQLEFRQIKRRLEVGAYRWHWAQQNDSCEEDEAHSTHMMGAGTVESCAINRSDKSGTEIIPVAEPISAALQPPTSPGRKQRNIARVRSLSLYKTFELVSLPSKFSEHTGLMLVTYQIVRSAALFA